MTHHQWEASPILLLEHWRPVEGFRGIYQVSNVGNVCRTLDRWGRVACRHLKKVRSSSTGYDKVALYLDARPITKHVHQLVAYTFHGPPAPSMTVNHIDGRKPNNRASNLEYLTRGENTRHAYFHGLGPRGDTHHNTKLKWYEVEEIRKLVGIIPRKRIGELYGVSEGVVNRIAWGRTWKHLPQNGTSSSVE